MLMYHQKVISQKNLKNKKYFMLASWRSVTNRAGSVPKMSTPIGEILAPKNCTHWVKRRIANQERMGEHLGKRTDNSKTQEGREFSDPKKNARTGEQEMQSKADCRIWSTGTDNMRREHCNLEYRDWTHENTLQAGVQGNDHTGTHCNLEYTDRPLRTVPQSGDQGPITW